MAWSSVIPVLRPASRGPGQPGRPPYRSEQFPAPPLVLCGLRLRAFRPTAGANEAVLRPKRPRLRPGIACSAAPLGGAVPLLPKPPSRKRRPAGERRVDRSDSPCRRYLWPERVRFTVWATLFQFPSRASSRCLVPALNGVAWRHGETRLDHHRGANLHGVRRDGEEPSRRALGSGPAELLARATADRVPHVWR